MTRRVKKAIKRPFKEMEEKEEEAASKFCFITTSR
jgi:hypothetical protein